MKRLLVSLAIGLVAGLAAYLWHGTAGDLFWPLRAARDVWDGRDPYDYPYHEMAIPYPLPAALVVFPLAWLPPFLAGALFVGLSSTALAFGVLREGRSGLLVFASAPYVAAVRWCQWSPLMLAACYLPLLIALVPAKPHIGAAAVAAHPDRRGLLGAALLVLISLVIMPAWPLRWLSQLGPFGGIPPALAFPPLLLAALCWRSPRARLLLVASLAPGRLWYDALLPFGALPSWRWRVAWVVVSWLMFWLDWLPRYVLIGALYGAALAAVWATRSAAP